MLAVVTGGFGFLGSHLCEALSRDGWQFVVLDLLRPEAINLKYVCGLPGFRARTSGDDVAEQATWADLAYDLGRERPDVVFHLAAETHVDRSLGLDPTSLRPLGADPVERLYRTNVIGTARAAEFARSVGARLVHWSTDEVYGDCVRSESALRAGNLEDGVCRRIEPAPFVPSSPYAASKMASEAVVHASVRLGLRSTILRPSNAYGPRQARDKLVPMAIGKLSRGEPVPLYDGGWQVRQWVHAADIARAALLAAGGTDGGTSGTFNIGGPSLLRNVDLVEYLVAAGQHLGKVPATMDPIVESVPDRPGHDAAYAVRSALAKRELGWEPSRSIEQDAAEIFAAYASP